MNQHITVQKIEHNGVVVAERDEMLSLTDMWKAASSPANKDPAQWLRLAGTVEFVECVAAFDMGKSHIKKLRGSAAGNRGGGGTYANWQIALAYAKYLDPVFHMKCNEIVRERMEGKSVSVASLPQDVLELIRRTDGIARMQAHKVTGIETTVHALVASVAAIAAAIRPPGDGIYVTGRSAGEIWKAAGFPPIRVTCWFSNRLVKMGCQMDDGRRIPVGLGRAKLFDPDKAENWLRNGGRKLVEEYIAQRQGQGRLRLVAASASPAH